jgi:hypothetical protein
MGQQKQEQPKPEVRQLPEVLREHAEVGEAAGRGWAVYAAALLSRDADDPNEVVWV